MRNQFGNDVRINKGFGQFEIFERVLDGVIHWKWAFSHDEFIPGLGSTEEARPRMYNGGRLSCFVMIFWQYEFST